jgi:hypothetical protein
MTAHAVVGTPPEDVRNKLLRRVDWRFLLDNPQPRKSMCFADGLLRKAVESISGSVVEGRTGSPTDCDLAVARNPNQTMLRAAWAALRPGASCYTEWYSPLAGGAKGIRRQLESAGFRDVVCYWCWPSPSVSPARYWLPLGAPGALRYFAASRFSSNSAFRRLFSVVRRGLWLLCVRIGIILPVCAVARKPAIGRSASGRSGADRQSQDSNRPLEPAVAPADLFGVIRSGWEDFGLGATPDGLSSLVLTGGPRSISKVVMLIFAEPYQYPKLAVKMTRIPEALPGLVREASTLRAIHALPRGGVPGAPRVLFCHERPYGFFAVGETALSGQPLSSLVRRSNFRHLALKGTEWLSGLAQRSASRPEDRWRDRLVTPVLSTFAESFGLVMDTGLFRDAADVVGTLSAARLICEQRDFAPWNALATPNGELAVLDWESAELNGLPAMDLIYFLTFLAFSLEGAVEPGRCREVYRATLDPSTLVGAVRHECLTRYARSIGLESAEIGRLGLLVWMLHSRSEYQRFVADIAGTPGREILRRSLFMRLLEEELRDLMR